MDTVNIEAGCSNDYSGFTSGSHTELLVCVCVCWAGVDSTGEAMVTA